MNIIVIIWKYKPAKRRRDMQTNDKIRKIQVIIHNKVKSLNNIDLKKICQKNIYNDKKEK